MSQSWETFDPVIRRLRHLGWSLDAAYIASERVCIMADALGEVEACNQVLGFCPTEVRQRNDPC